MRKSIFVTAALVVITGVILFGCDTSSEKVKDAREDVKATSADVLVAKKDLQQAIKDSTEDFHRFHRESEERISNYEKNIAELKVRIAAEKKANRTKYEKIIADLELKTAAMKADLKEYNEDGKDNWAEFKIKFNRNMDDIGNSITNFFTNDKK